MKLHRILKAEAPISEKQLDDLYEAGWQLIQIIQYNNLFYFYFQSHQENQ